jgi:hypothetical protein
MVMDYESHNTESCTVYGDHGSLSLPVEKQTTPMDKYLE